MGEHSMTALCTGVPDQTEARSFHTWDVPWPLVCISTRPPSSIPFSSVCNITGAPLLGERCIAERPHTWPLPRDSSSRDSGARRDGNMSRYCHTESDFRLDLSFSLSKLLTVRLTFDIVPSIHLDPLSATALITPHRKGHAFASWRSTLYRIPADFACNTPFPHPYLATLPSC